MTRASALEYITTIRLRYFQADRLERSRLLSEAAIVTRYHRKHLLRLLHRSSASPLPQPRHRPRTYTPEVVDALRIAWEACGHICSRRLHSFLPELVPLLGRVGVLQIPPQTAATLVQISPATIDRVLAPFRRALRPRGLSTTKPGTLPAQPDSHPHPRLVGRRPAGLPGSRPRRPLWPDHRRRVRAHAECWRCRHGWCECIAIPNRGQRATFAALQEIPHRLPVPLRGLDSDNDSAFINDQLLRYCRQERITFTRCRPYRKNDQAHIEQKNWSVVRRLIGYDRYETAAAVAMRNAIY